MQFLATLTSFLFAYAGMASLSLAIDRHYEQLTRQRDVPADRRRLARLAGWVLLLLSMGLAVHAWTIGAGLAFWCALLMLASLAVACGMTYLPRLTAVSGFGAIPLGLLGMGVVCLSGS